MNYKHHTVSQFAVALASLAGLPLLAQEKAADNEQDPASRVVLDQLVVTATRREQPLQRVPLAVSVVSGAKAETENNNTLFAIASQVPTLTFRPNTSNKDTSLFIRGVGTITTSPGVEPSVSTVVDGVVLGRPGQATLDLFDIERIEVLRGPQGTLFGKNASAGVVNIVTKAPAETTGGYVDASYFSDDEYRVRIGVSGTIKPGLASFSIGTLYGHYDGNVTNVATDETVNGYDKRGVRGKLQLTPTKDLTITLAADYLESKDSGTATAYTNTLTAYPSGVVTTYPIFTTLLAPVVPGTENREVNSNFKTHVADTNYGTSATADLKLGEHTLTSITAYRHWANDQYQNGDQLSTFIAGIPQSHDYGILRFDQYSQELRIASPKDQSLEYVAGVFYYRTENDEIYRRDIKRIVGIDTLSDYGVAPYGTDSTSYSAFAEATWNITERFRAIGGLRGTYDELDYYHSRYSTSTADLPGIRAAYTGSGNTDASGLSGRTGLQYDLVPKQATAYVTYSRGYKGPAYNVFFNYRSLDAVALDPETSDSFELGLKTTTLKNRLVANLAAFTTSYDGYQANFTDVVAGTPVTRLINAGSVQSRGVELDLLAHVTPAFSLGASAAYTHARIDHFNLPTGLTPAQIAAADIDGGRLPFSPDWRATVNANYRFNLSPSLVADVGTDYSWQSSVQYDLGQFADTIQDAYGIWNGSFGVSTADGHWRFTLLVKNIADKSYAAFLSRGSLGVLRIVPRDDQRYFGANIRYAF